jgi:hypothetical protein
MMLTIVRMNLKNIFIITCLLFSYYLVAQEPEKSEIHGNFGLNGQTYIQDSLIGASNVAEKYLMNSYGNVVFTKGNFTAGVRYEAYLNALKGYDERYNGIGVPYRFVSYQADNINFTVGSYYEQFGNGLILRTYEDKDLGYDNALEGIKVVYQPIKGIVLKGLVGKQHLYFELGPGIVRGVDGDISLIEVFSKDSIHELQVLLGGSFVSKYQADEDPVYILPENVGAGAARISLFYKALQLKAEYAYKSQDPSADNHYIYKNGEAFLMNVIISKKGFGLFLNCKRVDNMSFRSDRNANLNNLSINYMPPSSKAHTYSLASLYPFSSQPNGEMGFQSEFSFRFKQNSILGGKYGTFMSFGYAQTNSIQKTILADGDGYTSDFFKPGKEVYFKDLTFELEKRFNKSLKGIFHYYYQEYNKDIMQGLAGYGMIYSHIGVADISWKIKPKHNLRMELQTLFTKQDKGDWAMALLEYTYSPNWYFTILDMYNYGNPDTGKQLHYYSANFAYSKKGNRIQLGYGRMWEGILCIGGVCRNVPASNGFNISMTSTF